MCCRQHLFLPCLFILYFVILDTTARPSYRSNSKDISFFDPNLRSQSRTTQSLSPLSYSTVTVRSITDLAPGHQTFLKLDADWNMYYSSWTGVSLPTQPAAAALVQLYSSMVRNGGSIWRLSPPLHRVPLQVGNVQLRMYSPEEPIPWDLVVMFGYRLLELTQGGWTGLYDLMLSNAKMDMTIYVVLEVLDHAQRRIHP